MPKIVAELPAVAQQELENCCRDGLTAAKTRLRLGRCGVWLTERTVVRRMGAWRKHQALAAVKAAQREERIFDLREIGRGMALANLGIGAPMDIVGAAIPDWNDEFMKLLKQDFCDFVTDPTPARLTAVICGSVTFLTCSTLARAPKLVARGPREFAPKPNTAKEGA